MNIASRIEQTNLRPETTVKQIDDLVNTALENNFFGVCVNPSWVKHVKKKLGANKNLKIVTVIGFPLGANCTQVKIFETKLALNHGTDEVDMVMNIGKFKQGQDEYVLNEIKQVKKVCGTKTLKIIIETALLNKDEKIRACKLVVNSGAEFVKTSTGFSYSGATKDDVLLLSKHGEGKIKVKASGGIKSRDTTLEMLRSGAERIGTSQGVKIIEGKE